MVRTKKLRSLEEKQRIVSEVQSGRSASEVARDYGVHPSLVSKWVKWSESGELSSRCKGSPGYGSEPSSSDDREVQKLQAELKRYKEKVGEQTLAIDLLKKALEDSDRRKKLNGSAVTGQNWDPSKRRAK